MFGYVMQSRKKPTPTKCWLNAAAAGQADFLGLDMAATAAAAADET